MKKLLLIIPLLFLLISCSQKTVLTGTITSLKISPTRDSTIIYTLYTAEDEIEVPKDIFDMLLVGDSIRVYSSRIEVFYKKKE